MQSTNNFNSQTEQHTPTDNTGGSDPVRRQGERSTILRYNPRLVFTNPDDFFNGLYSDLLMEQQEQQ